METVPLLLQAPQVVFISFTFGNQEDATVGGDNRSSVQTWQRTIGDNIVTPLIALHGVKFATVKSGNKPQRCSPRGPIRKQINSLTYDHYNKNPFPQSGKQNRDPVK